MSMAGWGGVADLGFSGVPPEVQEKVERYMAEGPPAVAEDPPEFSQSDYDRRPFTMRRFLRPHFLALFGVFALVASEAVLAQAGPLLLQIAVDDGIRAHDRGVVVTAGVIFAVFVPRGVAGRERRLRNSVRILLHQRRLRVAQAPRCGHLVLRWRVHSASFGEAEERRAGGLGPGRQARNRHACRLQRVPIANIHLIPVTVALIDYRIAVEPRRKRSSGNMAFVRA